MEEFDKLNNEEKSVVLSLFAFKTGCLYYNTASLYIAFRDTLEEVKQYYIKSAKEFIKMYNLIKNSYNNTI